ncbi:MAG TPA: CoA-transferase [Terriglobia bacterium]|nr:CoA-transferase [Terriglobia bacterium]
MTTQLSSTSEEMMTIAAARRFRNGATCFVGVGLPSTAACLAHTLYAPDAVLVYESGAIGSKPQVSPLSVADPDLADSAVVIATVPEIFAHWLQGGRIEIGFLGAAQIDRFGNINSTVIGSYQSPKVRLPGAGGAPHIAAHAKEIVVVVRQGTKTFVPSLDFLTTARCKGPTTVITDLAILETHPVSGELVVTSRHPSVTADQIREATGWPVQFAEVVEETPVPTATEVEALRDLNLRTERAHAVKLKAS